MTGLGGLGKTQQMVSFANALVCGEKNAKDVYWVTADGDVSAVVESLAF